MKRWMSGLMALLVVSGTLAEAKRIVTAGGTVTEIVFALGEGERVVAVDTSSVYPSQDLAGLPRVGYVRQLAAEGLISLAPDLFLTTVDAGPPAVLAQIRAAGVRVEVVPPGSSWEAAKARIRFVAQVLGSPPGRAEALVARLDLAQARVSATLGGRDGPTRVLFIYARGAGTLMVSGRGTEADAMIGLAGAVNVVTQYEGYRPLTPEAVAAAKPDVVLFTAAGLQSLGGREGVAKLPAFADRVTLDRASVVALDDLLLLGFGPRLGEAVESLRAHFPRTR